MSIEIMDRVKNTDTRIWTPEGSIPLDVVRAKRVIEEYDENLTLGRHTMTGDWCIWLKRGPDQPPYPVIGLGRDLPDDTEILVRLKRADTRIHGDAQLRRMWAENDALRAERAREADEATGIAAEAYAWAHGDIKGYSGRLPNVKGPKRDKKGKT